MRFFAELQSTDSIPVMKSKSEVVSRVCLRLGSESSLEEYGYKAGVKDPWRKRDMQQGLAYKKGLRILLSGNCCI